MKPKLTIPTPLDLAWAKAKLQRIVVQHMARNPSPPRPPPYPYPPKEKK